MTKLKKLQIKKRGPRGPLLSMCSPIDDIGAIWPTLLAMIKHVYENRLDGLSANQCGLNKQLFITDVPGDHIRIFINPIVTLVDFDMDEHDECCASYDKPRVRYRHAHVIVDALNSRGERFVLDTSSPTYPEEVGRRLAARIQHEMEHMFGLDVREEPDVSADQTALADLLVKPARAAAPKPEFRLRPQVAALGSESQRRQPRAPQIWEYQRYLEEDEAPDLVYDYIFGRSDPDF